MKLVSGRHPLQQSATIPSKLLLQKSKLLLRRYQIQISPRLLLVLRDFMLFLRLFTLISVIFFKCTKKTLLLNPLSICHLLVLLHLVQCYITFTAEMALSNNLRSNQRITVTTYVYGSSPQSLQMNCGTIACNLSLTSFEFCES